MEIGIEQGGAKMMMVLVREYFGFDLIFVRGEFWFEFGFENILACD